MIMKRFFSILLLGSLLACCTKMDSIDLNGVFYEVINDDDVDFSMTPLFDPTLGDLSKYFFFIDKDIIFRAAAIKYKTVLPDNTTEVWASGVVYHPINKKSRGVIDFMPTAHLERGGAGSELLYAIEGVLAFQAYTIIMPDLIGCGISDNHPMPFLMVENTGRVSYDMRQAAAKYLLEEFGYELPAETVIMGYSLGGSAALATQKYYETHHANTIKVEKVFASSGVYDLPVAFEAFSKSGLSEYVAIPSTIFGLNHYYNLNLDYTKIFIGELKDNLINDNGSWLFGPGRLKAQQIINKLGRHIDNYMHPDFFLSWEDQKSTEFGKLHNVMIENSISRGWRPKAPIYMTHCFEDTYVPLECAEAAIANFRKAGANVSFFSYPGTHNTVGYLFFLNLILSHI